MEASLKALLLETITVYAEGPLDQYGRRTDGAATTHKARVEMGRRQVPVTEFVTGRDVYPDGRIFVDGKLNITPNAGVVLPTGDRVRLMAVDWVWDDVGVHHTVLHFGLNATAD